jgi:hypothetical protein
MTITATRPLPLTPDDAKILAHYAGGESAADICTATGFSLSRVGRVLDEHAGNNRELAHQIVLDYAERTQTAPPASPATAPAATTVPPHPAPAATAKPRTVEPASDHITTTAPADDQIAALLEQADSTGEPRLHRSAGKIRELVDGLRTDLAQHLREVPLRAEQARLRARLAEIDTELQGQHAPTTVEQPEVDTKKVRAWAAEQGLDCSTHGRVPGAVLTAYREAHQ